METIREDGIGTGARTISDRLKKLEEDKKLDEMRKDTTEKQKDWKWPGKWKRVIRKSAKKAKDDLAVVLYYNKMGHIEPPKLLPVYSGNIIIYKNSAHEFDPRAVWTTLVGGKLYKVVCIKEIDRRPISNLDLDEIKKRGDSTDSDEILVKMVTKAIIEKQKKALNKGLAVVIILALVAAVVFFLFMK